MAKSSFVKPGAAGAAQAAAPTRPAPAARPAPQPAARPVPAAAKAAPAPATRPVPARPAPTAASQPPATAPRPAPSRAVPAARPVPTPPPGVNTNVGQPAPAARRPVQRAATPPPEPVVEEEHQEEQTQDEETQVIPPGDAADMEGAVSGNELATVEGALNLGNLMTSPLGGIQGQLDTSDFEINRLGLTQSVGPLYEDHGFTPGDWVAGSSVILWQDGCEEIEITVMKVLKQWVENLPYGSDDMPRVYNTPQEAVAAGLQLTDWGREDAALPQANAMVLVKKNEGITDETGIFNLEGPDGFLYAVLLWRISGTAYGRVMKKLTGALSKRLRDGLHTGTFKLSARKEKGKLNTYWVPVLDPGDYHPAEMLEFIVENAGSEPAAD